MHRLARLGGDGVGVEDGDVGRFAWGEHAAVRLNWTLEVAAGGATERSVERGIDLFRRDPDGRWRISRTGYQRTFEHVTPLADLPGWRLTASGWENDGRSSLV